ncbi:hypothetical protein CCM_03427 [Cordyceps militaris CM01]|uniref:Uncharacterized protein n=1 Tax=Cordyceps militaris (strain CM01) TaxID=983644 RepID=G3JAP0_CORMM|nr:uncharacterized protein CCM_03427 [Cordyceps militaris CM01]EGX95155.1 hypothetical protein CCM_03427 [Cordyceps militaris CM01]
MHVFHSMPGNVRTAGDPDENPGKYKDRRGVEDRAQDLSRSTKRARACARRCAQATPDDQYK